jgi:hypothetical protein
MYEGENNCTQSFGGETFKEGDRLEDLDMDGK